VLAGFLFGLALLCKNTASPQAVLVFAVLAGLLVSRRATLREVVRWGLIYGGVALLVLAPYLAWNLATYGALNANAEVREVITPAQPHIPSTLHGLREHLRNVGMGLWDFQPFSPGTKARYALIFEVAVIAAVLGGLAVSLWRRSLEDALKFAWLGAVFPIAFTVVLAGTLSTYDGASTVVGRHLYGVLGLFAIAIAAGLYACLGPRMATLAVVVFIGLVFINERRVTDHITLATYGNGVLLDRLAPVVDQPLNEGYVTAASVSASAPCQAEAVGLAIVSPAPGALSISNGKTQQAAYLVDNQSVSIYGLAEPVSGPITIDTQGLQIGHAAADRDPGVSIRGAGGDPVLRLYCPLEQPHAFRFKQMFYPGHIDLSYSLVRAWPDAWYWAGWAIVATGCAGLAFTGYIEMRRRYEPSGLQR
jgi:hypothetical protein